MANVKNYLITDLDLVEKGVSGQGRFPELKSPAMQRKFDELVLDVVRPKHNGLIHEIEGMYATKEYVANQMFDAGAGDMVAEIYDPEKDGIVAAADVAERAENGIDEYAHRKSDGVHLLNKEGGTTNIKFLATADFVAGDTFSVNGTACSAQTSDGEPLSDGYFVSGSVVSAFQNGSVLNFKSGGAALNFKVVGGTTQPEAPSENTIWVNTDTEISKWVFASSAPRAHEDEINLIEGLTPKEGLISDAGNVLGADGTKQERYFEEYIPVSAGETIAWEFAFPSGTTRSILLSCCTYNESKTFVSRTLLVNQINGTSVSETFTIPTGISYIRVHYRSFGETPTQTIIVKRTIQDPVNDGLVWFQTSSASNATFNALKKNSIEVGPSAASQYIGGAWVDKNATVFQNGEWVSLMHAFLYGANQFEKVTGGWESNGTLSDAGVYLKASNSSSWTHYAYTKNAVDLTDVNSLIFDIVTLSNYSSTWVRCTVTATANDKSSYLASLVPTKKGVQTLDVSGISGKVFINIQAGNTSSVTVHSVTWE